MNNERYYQIIDEAYENYLKNFIEPTCPPNLDVQPSYYDPMTKDWFVKSAKERGSRGDEFSEKWGLKIEERDLTWEEQVQWVMKNTDVEWENLYIVEEIAKESTPKRLLTVIYKDEKIEIYE